MELLALALSKSNDLFAISGFESTYRLWDFRSLQEVAVLDSLHIGNFHIKSRSFTIFFCKEWVLAIAFSPNDRFLISAGSNRSVVVYEIEEKKVFHVFKDVHTGKLLSELQSIKLYIEDWILALTVSSCGDYIFTASTDRSFAIIYLPAKGVSHKFTNLHNGKCFS